MNTASAWSRFAWAVTLAAVVAAVVWGLDRAAMASVRRPELVDGWVLAGLLVLALGLHARKLLPVLPLLDVVAWARVHVLVGLCAGTVFVLHTGGRWPTGAFDTVLWLLFVAVSVSGLAGWGLQRILPARLRGRGGAMVAEHVPALRAALAREAADLVERAVRETGSRTLLMLYTTDVEPFLRSPSDRLAHLLESRRPARRLRHRLDGEARYLDEHGRRYLDELTAVVDRKVALDHQAALLGALKLWTLVHVPLTYALLLAAAVHLVVVHAFSAGGL